MPNSHCTSVWPRLPVVAVMVWVGLVLSGPNVIAQTRAKTCEVKITTPSPGDKVGREGRVRGTAKIPDGTFLWVFAHMKDLAAEWWPQGGRAAIINKEDGSWVIIVGYGQQQDVKEDFEVAAAVVDGNTNAQLRQWYLQAQKTGSYPPIEFPSVVDGCPPVKVAVVKTSH